MTHDSTNLRVLLIRRSMLGVKKSKHAYHAMHLYYKKIDLYMHLVGNLMASITLSTLIFNMSLFNSQLIAYIAVSSSFLSIVIAGILSILGLQRKIESCNTSYLQLSDLYSNTNAILIRNGMSNRDYDVLLTSINEKLGLIYDSSLPIDISESEIQTDSLYDIHRHEAIEDARLTIEPIKMEHMANIHVPPQTPE